MRAGALPKRHGFTNRHNMRLVRSYLRLKQGFITPYCPTGKRNGGAGRPDFEEAMRPSATRRTQQHAMRVDQRLDPLLDLRHPQQAMGTKTPPKLTH